MEIFNVISQQAMEAVWSRTPRGYQIDVIPHIIKMMLGNSTPEPVLLVQGTGSGKSTVPLTSAVVDGGVSIVIENTLAQHGIDSGYLKIEMELNSIEAIKNAVHSGLGAAFVSVSAITKELELDMLHWAKIEGLTIKRTLSILLNPKRYYSNATQIFKIFNMCLTNISYYT